MQHIKHIMRPIKAFFKEMFSIIYKKYEESNVGFWNATGGYQDVSFGEGALETSRRV